MIKSGNLFVKIGSPLHISHFLFILSKLLTPAYSNLHSRLFDFT